MEWVELYENYIHSKRTTDLTLLLLAITYLIEKNKTFNLKYTISKLIMMIKIIFDALIMHLIIDM